MVTPGVKWIQLFLMYLHPWKSVFMRDPLSGWLKEIDGKHIPPVMNLTEK